MIRVCIEPNTFEITSAQHGQNPYIDIEYPVVKKTAKIQHNALTKSFSSPVYVYKILSHHTIHLPDVVFVANGGLSLPRLPTPHILLPYMKYPQRKKELQYLKALFKDLDIRTISFPGSDSAPFEGQAELKWFHNGTLAVGGYGFRSTKKSFDILETLLIRIYKKYGIVPPKILALPLESDSYYHLDVAMLEYDDSKCIVHKRAFSKKSIQALEEFLGKGNVSVLDTEDSFCLNSVVDGEHLLTHTLSDPAVKGFLEEKTGLDVKQIDTSVFEKSGGSVRCMTLDIYPGMSGMSAMATE